MIEYMIIIIVAYGNSEMGLFFRLDKIENCVLSLPSLPGL